jgi:hypothetical protein
MPGVGRPSDHVEEEPSAFLIWHRRARRLAAFLVAALAFLLAMGAIGTQTTSEPVIMAGSFFVAWIAYKIIRNGIIEAIVSGAISLLIGLAKLAAVGAVLMIGFWVAARMVG